MSTSTKRALWRVSIFDVIILCFLFAIGGYLWAYFSIEPKVINLTLPEEIQNQESKYIEQQTEYDRLIQIQDGLALSAQLLQQENDLLKEIANKTRGQRTAKNEAFTTFYILRPQIKAIQFKDVEGELIWFSLSKTGDAFFRHGSEPVEIKSLIDGQYIQAPDGADAYSLRIDHVFGDGYMMNEIR